MNNFIEYFYNMKIDKIIYNDKYYSFLYNDYFYRLYIVDDNVYINNVVSINKEMLNNTLVSEIIANKDKEYISYYNGYMYVLIKIYVNVNKRITMEEIAALSNSLCRDKMSVNWGILWEKKIDYLEDLIGENGKKYPLIVDSFNYFVGLAENAISYYNNIDNLANYRYYISHKVIRFDDTIQVIYNPLNIIFDYKVRDIAEYVKNSFFNNNYNVMNELNRYLLTNNLSYTDVLLLVSRLLYPSFYFEMYEDILIDNKEEEIIINIVNRAEEYEAYLAMVIGFLHSRYNVPEIEWLKKAKY